MAEEWGAASELVFCRADAAGVVAGGNRETGERRGRQGGERVRFRRNARWAVADNATAAGARTDCLPVGDCWSAAGRAAGGGLP